MGLENAMRHMHQRAAVVAIAGILAGTLAQGSLTSGFPSKSGHTSAAPLTWTYDAEPAQQCVTPGRRPLCLRNAVPKSAKPTA